MQAFLVLGTREVAKEESILLRKPLIQCARMFLEAIVEEENQNHSTFRRRTCHCPREGDTTNSHLTLYIMHSMYRCIHHLNVVWENVMHITMSCI